MINCWKNSPRTARMIGMGAAFVGMMALLLLWPVISPDVAEAAGGEVIYVKAGADETGDGTSWENAFPDLQDALEEAVEGDQIWIAAGTYVPTGNGSVDNERLVHFRMKDGVEIYGGFAGDEDPTDFDLNERDFELNETILSGDLG